MSAIRTSLALSLGLIACLPFNASSEDSSSLRLCAQELRECFSLESDGLADCLYSSARGRDCASTSLAKVALKRWAVSSTTGNDQETNPEFLGPRTVDPTCVSKCDSSLMAGLIDIETSNDFVIKSNDCYDTCVSEVSPEILRP